MSTPSYNHEIITFVKKYDIPVRYLSQVTRYKELMLKENPTTSENEELNNLAVLLEPYNITAEDYNKCFVALQNMQTYISVDLKDYLQGLFAGYDEKMETMEATFDTMVDGMKEDFSEEMSEINQQQNIYQAWFDGAKNNITTLQSFYFQNWTELSGCSYKDYPKNDNGEYITTITSDFDNKMIAKQTEWQEMDGETKVTYLKQEVFDTDGVTLIKEKTKKEYKNSQGIYISEVI